MTHRVGPYRTFAFCPCERVESFMARFSIIWVGCSKVLQVFKRIFCFWTNKVKVATSKEPLELIRGLEASDLSRYRIHPDILDFDVNSYFEKYNRYIDNPDIIDRFPELFVINGRRIIEEDLLNAFGAEILRPVGEIVHFPDGETFVRPPPNYRRNQSTRYSPNQNEYLTSRGLRRLYAALEQLQQRAQGDIEKEAAYQRVIQECVTKMTEPGCVFQKILQLEACLLTVAFEIDDLSPNDRLKLLVKILVQEYKLGVIADCLYRVLPRGYPHVANLQRDMIALMKNNRDNYPGSVGPDSPIGDWPEEGVALTARQLYEQRFKGEFERSYKPLEFLAISELGPANGLPGQPRLEKVMRIHREIADWFHEHIPNLRSDLPEQSDEAVKALIPEAERATFNPGTDFYQICQFNRGAMLYFYKQIRAIS